MKTKLLIILLMPYILFSQEEENDEGIMYSISGMVEAVYQKQFLGCINLAFGFINYRTPIGLFAHGPFVGFENNFRLNNISGIKIGYSFDHFFGISYRFFYGVSFKFSVINYYSNNISDLRLMPEIGINIFSVLIITYGYSIPIFEKQINEIGKHRIALTIKMPMFIYEKNKWYWFF